MRLLDTKSKLTNQEADLVGRIAEGDKDALIYIYMMRESCRVAKQLDYIQILSYLRRNKIVGNRFLEWVIVEHNRAIVRALADARMKMTKDYKMKAVIAKGY
jgi:hypothetical protein